VRQAVEVAGIDRIGHGVDVMYEQEPEKLLKDMAAKQVLVEINLTSNEDVLGVSGKSHPFPIYCKFGVPVALSTDDEGIERIDLTTNMSARPRATISATPTSSSSCATALNTAFCPA
jgi:adenosine deaminase